MATRAERFRSESQRKSRPKHRSIRKAPKQTWVRATARVRTKRDAAYNVTEEVREAAPTSRARKMRAKTKRVRGSRG